MALGSSGRGGRVDDERVARNWARLDGFMSRGVKVGLLNEAQVRPGTKVLYGSLGTQGRDGAAKPRAWSTAIVSRYGPEPIVGARPKNYLGHERTRIPFESSRPGAWTAATVDIPGVGSIAFVSLYGLLDDVSDDSVHRSLSEISPIFSDARYQGRVVLGGDLNLSTQLAGEPGSDLFKRTSSVFDRIEGHGLVDCLAAKRSERLEGCPCRLGGECRHTRTKWQGATGRRPLQMDYIFASRELVADDRLARCRALDPDEWKDYSDHAPLIATFRV
jgi:hypothetical protein